MNADNITLDLNGFSILGPTVCIGDPVTSCSPLGTGIGVDFGPRRNITVVNGIVRGMGNTGLDASAGGNSGGHIEKIHADSNGVNGIVIVHGTVSGSTAIGNGSVGISLRYSTVSGSIATANAYGFSVIRSTVTGNTATNNLLYGIDVYCPSSVVGNTSTGNGINLALNNITTQCAVANNAAP